MRASVDDSLSKVGSRKVQSGRLMTPSEVAEYLRISVKTLANWRSRNTGPPFLRIGGRVRYRQHAMDEWIEPPSEQTDADQKPFTGSGT
jgi:excisionase family DNA binding protein